MEPALEQSSICSVAALFILLVLAYPLRAQETPPAPPEEAQETQEPAEGRPKGGPRPPEGILPVGEIVRISFAPSDRPNLLLHGNRLVVTTASGGVEGRDAASGEFRWKLGLPGETLFAPVVYRREPFEILLSSTSGRVFVVDAETGEIRRETELPCPLAIAPLVDPPDLYLGTPNGEVIAFDLEKSSERFRFQAGESPLALSSSGGLLAASGSQHTLIAIEAARGDERFRLRGRGGFYAPAVFAQDRIYIGNDAGEFYCLAPSNGDTDFRWSTGAAIRFAALVEDRFVFVTSFGNNLYAFQARGGAERFRVSLPGRPASGPVRFGRRLVVVTYDGAIVEIDPQKAEVGKTYEAPGELAGAPAFLPASPSPGKEWYAQHRIALALRTGEVLLLGYRAGLEEEEEEKTPEPQRPPPPTGTAGEDSLSWK